MAVVVVLNNNDDVDNSAASVLSSWKLQHVIKVELISRRQQCSSFNHGFNGLTVHCSFNNYYHSTLATASDKMEIIIQFTDMAITGH